MSFQTEPGDALNGAVLERMIRVVAQRHPRLLGQAADEKVVVVGRVGDQRPEPSRVRLHDHDAARLVAEQFGEPLLELGVEAQLQVFAVLRLLHQRLAERTPEHVHLDAVQSLVTAQTRLENILQPLFAHRVAEGEVGIGGEFLFVGFGDVPENVREFLAFRVVAFGTGHDFQTGPVHELRLDARHLIERHVGEQQDGLERLDLALVLLKTVRELIQRNVRPFADLRQRRIDVLAVLADQREPEGGPVLSKKNAVDVADEPARRVHRFLPQVVGLRLLREVGPPVYLEIPEADHEDEEQQPDEALQQQESALGRLIAFRFKLYCFHWKPPAGGPSGRTARRTASAALAGCFRRAAGSCREE